MGFTLTEEVAGGGVIPLVVALTVTVTFCETVIFDRLVGMETLLHMMDVFVSVQGVLMETEPQLVLLNDTLGFVPNPAPLMVTDIVVPAVHVAGETLVILIGSTIVMVVVFLIPVSFW
jgi:hypothetical protein